MSSSTPSTHLTSWITQWPYHRLQFWSWWDQWVIAAGWQRRLLIASVVWTNSTFSWNLWTHHFWRIFFQKILAILTTEMWSRCVAAIPHELTKCQRCWTDDMNQCSEGDYNDPRDNHDRPQWANAACFSFIRHLLLYWGDIKKTLNHALTIFSVLSE